MEVTRPAAMLRLGLVPPPKKVPETDGIFDRLQEVHPHAAESKACSGAK